MHKCLKYSFSSIILASVVAPVFFLSCRDETNVDIRSAASPAPTLGQQLTGPQDLTIDDFRGFQCGSEVETARNASCGAEEFVFAPNRDCGLITEVKVHESCGAESYQSGAHPSCGVAVYNERADTACGTSARVFWSEWGGGCPGDATSAGGAIQVITGESEVRVHRSGFSVTLQRRYRCHETTVHRCRLPEFGPESFHVCPHPDFGVAQYRACPVEVGVKSCAIASNGILSFKECALSERSKSCQVKLSREQLKHWIQQTNTEFPAQVREALRVAQSYYELTQNTAGRECLYARAQRGDFFTADEENLRQEAIAALQASMGTRDPAVVPKVPEVACSDENKVMTTVVCDEPNLQLEACQAQRSLKSIFRKFDDLKVNSNRILDNEQGFVLSKEDFETLKALVQRVDRLSQEQGF